MARMRARFLSACVLKPFCEGRSVFQIDGPWFESWRARQRTDSRFVAKLREASATRGEVKVRMMTFVTMARIPRLGSSRPRRVRR